MAVEVDAFAVASAPVVEEQHLTRADQQQGNEDGAGEVEQPVQRALVIEGLKPQRPLTHDLISNFFSQFGIILKEVIINKLEEGVFFSTLVTEKDNKIQNIDARTSDAIALALRMKCPIYTYKSILNDAGIQYEENDTEGEEKEEIIEDVNTPVVTNDLNQLSLKELEAELEKAIKIEDYVRAALLRDEIKIRK